MPDLFSGVSQCLMSGVVICVCAAVPGSTGATGPTGATGAPGEKGDQGVTGIMQPYNAIL